MVREAINNLQGAFTLDVVGLHKYTKEQQVEILKVIAETRLKNVKINVAVDTAAGLQACLEALTDQRLSVFSSGRQIDVNVVVDFKHAAFNENAAELIAIFEGINDRAIPHVWDVMLRLNNMENVAYGDLTSIIRTVVRSSVGSNLCLGTLTPDNPSTLYVMKRVREEFAAPESKIRILDFEGSRLSEEGWEQLVLLAETGKRFSKIRLTGMPIPSPLAKRLGALRVKGINMAGCRVATEDLMEMVQGWLGEGSTLAGVDLRENGVNQSIVDLFQKAGFDAYLEDKKPPYGVMFVKPM
jgi:hypothetical protein